MATDIRRVRAELRRALADYMGSEGCSCCRGPEHEKHAATLARLLNVRKYADGSGYDFLRYRTESNDAT